MYLGNQGSTVLFFHMHYCIDLITYNIDVVIFFPPDFRAGLVYWLSSVVCVHVDMEVLHVIWY